MSLYKTFIKTFDSSGDYLPSFTEVTKDVLQISDVAKELDNTEYNIGIFRNSNLKISFNNASGNFLDQSFAKSIFELKRDDSIVRLEYQENINSPICGFAICGEETLNDPVVVYEGLIKDLTATSKIKDQEISLNILGFESLFDEVEVPFSTINNGDLISEVLFACLNQTKITELLTVSALNLSLNEDQTIDDKNSLENKTVKEAVEELLILSNSVLFIKDRTVFAKGRVESIDLKYSFYGPSSNKGIENIVEIKNYRNGKNKLFNYWVWNDTSLVEESSTSITDEGLRKKSIDSGLITNTTKRNNILTNYVQEFASKKVEMDLICPINYDTILLDLLDKVNIDYPNIYFSAEGSELPYYGLSKYGEVRYPIGQYSLIIRDNVFFKILSKKINANNSTITFGLREV